MTLDAPSLTLANSVGYPPVGLRDSQLFFPRLLSSSKFESPSVTSCSGLRSGRMKLLCPEPTSDNSSSHLSMPVVHDKLTDLPGNALLPSRLCAPHLRISLPYRYRTLKIIAFLTSLHASYAILVRRATAFPAATFRFHLPMDTLADQLTIPFVGFVGDFQLPVKSALPGAHKKKDSSISRRVLCNSVLT